MPKRLLVHCPGETIADRIFDVRQGLSLLFVPVPDTSPNFGSAGSVNGTIYVSPDQTAAIYSLAIATSGGNFRYIADPATLTSASSPPVPFAAIIYATAISNAHYAVGGNSPYLQVYSRSTHAVQSVSTAGLGTVNAIDFSPDGTKMAVGHNTSPYLRVYNTSDWTYSDVGAGIFPGSTVQALCYSSDGSHLATQSTGSPYLNAYTSMSARSFTSTSSTYAARDAGLRGNSSMCRNPLSGTTVIFAANAGTLADFDTAGSGTVTVYGAAGGGITIPFGMVCADPDASEDAVYLNHAPGTSGRTWTKWKLSNRTVYSPQPEEFRQFISANNNPYSGAAFLRTTPHNITGTVRDVNNSPAARVIRAFDRATGQLMAQTTSNAGTGNYTLQLFSAGPFDVQYMAASGELLNDIMYAKATPAAG